MAETCWYNNSEQMRLDDGCNNNNLNGSSVTENERWSCSGDTSLVEPEILEDMGVGMLADEASRESLQTQLKTQECTISPKNFEAERKNKKLKTTHKEEKVFKDTSFSTESIDRLDPFCNDDAVNFSTLHNESGYSSRVEIENFIESKENFSKEDSSDSSDKSNTDPFYLFRRKKKPSVIGEDKFNKLSDEMILMIMKWLPKKYLVRSMLVCKRWCQIARDEALWTRLDLGGKVLNEGTLGHILPRGVQILRLAQTEIISQAFFSNDENFETYMGSKFFKLHHLDLSMAVVSVTDLEQLLSRCRSLKKLSLEKCTINQSCCEAISKNVDLEVLNLTMCEGMDLECIKYLTKLKRLSALNLAWCNLDSETMTYFCKSLSSSVTRLNVAGCRKTLTDNNFKDLVQRCPNLAELDLSDCTMLSINTLQSLVTLNELEHLSLSRCYSIPTSMHLRIILLPKLKFLDIFGLVSEDLLKTFKATSDSVEINKFPYSSVARPTVGVRRTSIWGQRVRD